MTAPTKTLRTAGETALIERFASARATFPGTEAIARLREKAFSSFEQRGLPHRRVETWKYSDLRNRLKTAQPLAVRPSADIAATALNQTDDVFAAIDRYRLVMVDGVFIAELSDRDDLLAEGVEVAAAAELLAKEGNIAADLMATPALIGDDVAVALNTAFSADGVVVFVKDGSRPTKPIEIVNIASGPTPAAVYSRHRVVVGADSKATFLENVLGGCKDAELNTMIEYRVGAGARLKVARVQATDTGATQIATNFVSLGAKSELKHLSVEAGAAFSRNQTFVAFSGEHARADILGVSMANDHRHVDQTLVVEHVVPHCGGTELFKTVLDDEAHGVFQGQILVRAGAQKTNSKMMSQALLLSEETEMDAKPELEIFADDVICGHGATVGQIDPTMLFYLMARGIPRAEAERLLIEAFVADAIDGLDDAAIGDALKAKVSEWLGRRDSGARE